MTRPTDEIRARPSAAASALPRIAWIEEARIDHAWIDESRVDGASAHSLSRLARGARRRAARAKTPTDAELDCLARLLALPHPQSLMSQADGFMATQGSGSSRSALLGHLPRGSNSSAAACVAFLTCIAAALALSPYFLQNLPHDFASDGSLRARESFAGMSGSPPRGDREMRKSVVSGVVAGAIASGVIGGVPAPVHAQNAVQWRVEDGGNGHWYAIHNDYTNWTNARTQALAVGADLASLATLEEWMWARAWLPSILHGYWLGGRQLPNSKSPHEGWFWLTGEPVQTEWMVMDDNPCGSSPPGVEDMQQDFLHTCCEFYPQGISLGDLDDFGGWGCDLALRSLFEWSADCNSDGVVDFGQIRAGELDDANANNIPDCCEQGVACLCPSDIDGNGNVDAIDLAIVIGYWGTNGGKEYPQADIDRSGDIDAADLTALLGSWGPCE